MRLYNTLERRVMDFVPNKEGIVKMYTCGPTVYHYAHIGNLRTYIFEDILEKSLTYLGYKVDRVMNITDVGHLTSDSDSGEDKMLKGAKREGKSVLEIADMYTKAFQDDMRRLNIKWPDRVSNATDNIDMYIKIIEKLLDSGYAYLSGGNVYFDTSKLDDYYKLTNHKVDYMVTGVRDGVDADSNKRSQADFVLWFTKSKFQDQELKWDSPWGFGYPGWHIECSGIAIRFLGEELDIHCGGVDNIFPHHTNEIAQSEAYLGHKWCNYWVHGEHLNDSSGKMSKSNGDFLTVNLLCERGYNPLDYRYLCLNTSYRKVLNFSFDVLDGAAREYKRLKSRIGKIEKIGDIDRDKFNYYNDEFKRYIGDDLNTSMGITVLYDVIKDKSLNGNTKLEIIRSFDEVLSLDLVNDDEGSEVLVDEKIEKLISERNKYKSEKNFLMADKIRDELLSMGIIIRDTRDGVVWERVIKH